MRIIYERTYTYKILRFILGESKEFATTLGEIVQYAIQFIKELRYFNTSFKEILEQASRFGISSLPITLSIVGITSIIIAMQVAGEMVKHGGGNFVGMLMSILIVREESVIMSGFAIISMIGSSLTSEIATMKITDQTDAMKVLHVSPINYLFTPRIIAGTVMMPLVVIVASLVGILCGAFASNLSSGLSFKAYFDSVWFGLKIHDINVCILKATVYGFLITLISCAFGMMAKDGAKGVGIATTKSVVWSFVTIVIFDLIFATIYFY